MTMKINSYNNNNYNQINNNRNISKANQNIASGKKINSAADDAAGLAIAKKLESIIKGLDKGSDNSYDMQNLVNTAEGGLSTIEDGLQRMRELTLQAGNATLSDSDRGLIQKEMDQIKDHITTTSQNTQFNGQNVLDGTFVDKSTASDAHGNGMNVDINGSGSADLGIDDVDVTKSFDIGDIDRAMESIAAMQSDLGAYSNRLDSTISSNSIASQNMTQSLSRIQDADIAKEVINSSTNKALEDYRLFAQKQAMENSKNKVSVIKLM